MCLSFFVASFNFLRILRPLFRAVRERLGLESRTATVIWVTLGLDTLGIGCAT